MPVSMIGNTQVPLGLLCSTTGTYGPTGQAILSGALLAIEQIAADPEFDFTFKPTIADPGGNVARYLELSQEMLHDGKIAHVMGCYTSSSRKEVVPLFERADALLWYPTHYEGFECSENVIYVGASPNQHIVPLAGFMMSAHGKRVYMIGSNYVWSWESNRVMRDIVESNGGSVVAERYLPVGVTDTDRVIAEIQLLNPDFVFSSLIGTSTAAFLQAHFDASNAVGNNGERLAPVASCNMSEIDLLALSPQARVDHICSSVYFQSIDSPANHAFVDQYRARFGQSVVTPADAEASYIAVHLLARAIRMCGSTDVSKVRQVLPECRFDAPQGNVWIDADNQHSFFTPRIGRSTQDSQFEIVFTAERPVKPDPYLAWFDPKRNLREWHKEIAYGDSQALLPLSDTR
jgi:ABC-type branched-subunit amino acid transport system substrate-binding protein